MTPKFKDKGKKVLEAKAAWDSYKGKKTIVVNNLADEFSLKGGKWMCHLPTSMIDRPGVGKAGNHLHVRGAWGPVCTWFSRVFNLQFYNSVLLMTFFKFGYCRNVVERSHICSRPMASRKTSQMD